ncbi:hypothetical protein HDG34_003406 [Paraburkholderia sp. HC6.4b]|nr:hypothetical protein [Paraburkholderia sp. HC6.4b]MBB5451194.1 hypothetical protein [Paraburkholderia sp. Kb1A]
MSGTQRTGFKELARKTAYWEYLKQMRIFRRP